MSGPAVDGDVGDADGEGGGDEGVCKAGISILSMVTYVITASPHCASL